jgi:hypothetical protein
VHADRCETPSAGEPAQSLLDRCTRPGTHHRPGDDDPATRRQHAADDVPFDGRRGPERPHIERDDDVELVSGEVRLGQGGGAQADPPGLDRLPVPAGRRGDHGRRAVDTHHEAAGQPGGERGDQDAVTATDAEDDDLAELGPLCH